MTSIPGSVLPILAAGLLGLPIAGCQQYKSIHSLSFELLLAPDRNISLLDMAHADPGQLVKILDAASGICTGANEFKEYNSEAPIVILDGAGREIGRAPLGTGRILEKEKSASGMMLFRGCRFKVEIPLSAQSRVYRFDLANGKYKKYLHVSTLVSEGGKVSVDLD